MNKDKIKKPNLHSIIVKFLLAFFLFGGLLVLITVSIQNDLAEKATEELTAAREMQSLTVLEKNLGSGEWAIKDHFLCKGDTVIGNGSWLHANIEPFQVTETETASFVYSFLITEAADEEVLRSSSEGGREVTPLIRVAGSTLDAAGNPIVGTFLDRSIAEPLLEQGVYSGRSYVEGRLFYCYYRVISDGSGRKIGALVAGHSIEEFTATVKKSALNSSLAIAVIILYTFFALFLFVAKWNRSLKRTEDYLVKIGKGDFPDDPLQISGRDELSEMADVINEMKTALLEKERLRNELELARRIQAELLPDEDAAKSLPENFSVQGFMMPAREVGGDLYDFFMIDEDRLGIVIADVSDKGAPAALFMATAKMCIKDNMMLGMDPQEVLRIVNNRLLENNRSGLFVTAWIGVLDRKTGRLQYAMAGHPYPLLRRASGAEYETLVSDINLVLAGLPDFVYRQAETVLSSGDRLFLYTDGLDEARDILDGFFGKQRILNHLNARTDGSIGDLISGMKEQVDAFSGGREQFDDLTMLMVEYTGGSEA